MLVSDANETGEKDESKMADKNETVERIMKLRDVSLTGWREAREKAELVRNFIRHEPYTAEQLKEAEEFKKPLLRYSVLVAKLLGLEGQELVNRRKIIFEPRYHASSELVRILHDNYEYISNREELNTKLIRAMVDGLCYPTMGWLRRTIKMDDFGYLTYGYDNYDSFLVHPDPTLKKLDLFDCGYVGVDHWMTMNKINKTFEPNPFSSHEERYAYQLMNARSLQPESTYGTAKTIDGDRYLVVEMEERVTKKVNICEVDGEIQALTTQEADRLASQGKKVEYIRESSADRIRVTTILPSHDIVLSSSEYQYDTSRFSFFPCSSYDWMFEKCKHPSLMYILTDIQDSISKAKSQHLDFMIQQLVEDYHVAASEDKAIQDIEQSKGKPFKIIRYRNINNRAPRDSGSKNAGALASIQNDIYMSLDFMSEVSNITPAMEGKAGKSGESGALFQAKVERGITTTNPYYEIKAQTNLRVAKDFLELAKDVYFEDDRKLEKKRDPKTGLTFEIVNLQFGGVTYNDVRKARIEAVLDQGENTELKLEQTFQENLAMVQMLLNAGVPAETIDWVNIVMNSNLRDKHKWAESLAQAQGLMEMYAKENLANTRMSQEQISVAAQAKAAPNQKE